MRPRDDVYGYEFAYASCGGGAGVGGGFYSSDITSDDSRDEPGTYLFVSDELNVGCLDHGVGSFDHRNKTLGLDHS